MSTVQQIIDRGFAKSAAARPDTMTATSELVNRVGVALRECFQTLSREAPQVLGVRVAINFDGAGWPRPADCLKGIRVETDAGTIIAPALAVGTPVRVVPYNDLLVWEGAPCLTELGQSYVPSGQAIDPSAGSLTLTYARAPIRPTAPTDDVDSMFPSFFDDYLESDIAGYLASKDERAGDMQTFQAEKDDVLLQIVDWARGQTLDVVQRFPLTTPPLASANAGRAQPLKG